MKVKKYYSENEIERSGVAKTKEFKLSKHAEETIFNMFTKNIYSRPIDSVVREITSNCFDSHIEAGVSDPVIIRYKVENNQEYISFIDVGIGMSPDRMENVYSIYFESTKDQTDDQLGGYGIGGKTPLAYTDSFFIITVFENIKYTYAIGKGPSSPVLDLLMAEPTQDRNGTEIKIPLKPHDIRSFVKALQQQLYYFENIIFEGFSNDIKNEYTIYRGKSFWYRGNGYSNKMHVCLGRVAYPIDYGALGLSEITIPVAIKLDIGEIPVGVSRENIEYSNETIIHLKQKIQEVKKELIEMMNKQYGSIQSIEDYYFAIDKYGQLSIDRKTLEYIDVRSIYNANDIKFDRFSSLKIPEATSIMSLLYDIKFLGKKGKKHENWYKSFLQMRQLSNIYYLNGELTKNKKHAYMLSVNNNKYYTIRLKDFSDDLVIEKTIRHAFSEKDRITGELPKTITQSQIKHFKQFVNEFDAIVKVYSKDYDTVVIPADFRLERKSLNIADIHDMDAEFSIRNMEDSYSTRINIHDLLSYKGTIFYGFRDDRENLEKCLDIYEEFDPKSTKGTNELGGTYFLAFILISKQNEKAIKLHKNAYHINDFVEQYLSKKKNVILNQINDVNFNVRYKKLPLSVIKNQGFKKVDVKMYSSVLQVTTIANKIKKTEMRHDAFFYSSLFKKLNITDKYISPENEILFSNIEKSLQQNKVLDFIKIPENNDFSENAVLLNLIKTVYIK